MRKKKVFIFFSVAFVILFFFLAKIIFKKIESMKVLLPKGYILIPYYSNGIIRVNLQNLKVDSIYNYRYVAGGGYGNLRKISNNKLLFVSNCSKKANDYCIRELNLSNMRERFVYKGFSPFYMSNTNKLIFSEFGKGRIDLYIINYGDEQEKANFIGSASVYIKDIFQVSSDKIFIVTDNKLLEYDENFEVLKEIYIQNCDQFLVWRSNTKQALCRDNTLKKDFLIDLNGNHYEDVNFHRDGYSNYGFAYLPKTDQLMISRLGDFAITSSCQIYSFKEHAIRNMGKIACWSGMSYYSPEESEFVSKLKPVDNKK